VNGTRRHWAALPVVAGGLTWTAWAVVAATAGTVADGVALSLVIASGLLLAVGLAGLVVAFDWAYQFPGGEGAALAAVGSLSFAVGQALRLFRGDGGLATWLLAPGVLALVAGSLLLAAGLVRARRLRRGSASVCSSEQSSSWGSAGSRRWRCRSGWPGSLSEPPLAPPRPPSRPSRTECRRPVGSCPPNAVGR